MTVEELASKSGKTIEELNAMSAEELTALKESLSQPAPAEAVQQLAAELGMTVEELASQSGKTIEELNAMSAEELAALKESLTQTAPVIGTITSLTIQFGDVVAGNDTVVLPDTAVTASWTVVGDVASYTYEIKDSTGTAIATGSGADATSYEIAAGALTAGEEYTLTVKAIPTNGTETDATTATAKFKRNAAPVVGMITSLTIKFGDVVADNDTVILPDEAVTASWVAEGDVASFAYEIKDTAGTAIATGSGEDATSYEIAIDAITAGEEYTLTVKAIPTNGTETDATAATAKFKRNAPVVASGFVMANGVVTGYTGEGGDIVIPSVDGEGKTITAIGEEAFKDNTTITSVSISANVTEIGKSAFEGCTGLESVTIPNGVTLIGKAAFKNCEKLASMSTFD